MTPADYREVIERALTEDLGEPGDITSVAVIPETALVAGRIIARAPGVVAGVEVAEAVFHRVDPAIRFDRETEDGETVLPGISIARLRGPARSVLTAERTALNLLGRMSGVATATRRLVDAVSGTNAVISDTRKTMPGMRALDKHAVVMGGGVNHRMGLYDAVMIKDNHLVAAGGIAEAVARARAHVGAETRIVVEVEDLTQLDQVLLTDADQVLLDNMDLPTLRMAVERVAGRLVTEASGGITEANVREIASTGVDVISVGWITHSSAQLDVALDFASPEHPR